MITTRVDWLRITVGYEALFDLPAGQARPDLRDLIETTFAKGSRDRWGKAGHTDLPIGVLPGPVEPTDDSWVAHVLQHELAAAIAANPLVEKLALKVAAVATFGCLHGLSGRPGTRCEIGPNGEWVNTRAYLLLADGQPWPAAPGALGYASLSWLCPGAHLEGWRLIPPGQTSDVSAGAARSRDAGTPGGASNSRARRTGRRTSP